MQLETIPTEYRLSATEKWREYVAAEKRERKPEYTDLKKIYAQVKQGKKVCDIFDVIHKGGIHPNFHPKLAIAQAKTKVIYCRYHPNGTVHYVNRNSYWSGSTSKPLKSDVDLPKCLPAWDRLSVTGNKYGSDFCLSAPVPLIPPQYLPKSGLTDDHYILWDVDKWEMAPPLDPWLLKRVTKTMFVVLAGWDLTELERAVMRGRF